MFSTSDLLTRDLVVFRATVAPNACLRLLGERGVEIARVVEEETDLPDGPVWLTVYDRENTRVLAVEKRELSSEGHRVNPIAIIDGQGQPVTEGWDWRHCFRDASGQPICRIKRRRGGGLRGPLCTIKDPTKTEVGNLWRGLPPDGDHQLGHTHVLTITAEITAELRLVALGWAISRIEVYSTMPPRALKSLARLGVAWPGCADVPALGPLSSALSRDSGRSEDPPGSIP